MLKKSASFVLASRRGSTYRSVRLASSLAAALLAGLFEHPTGTLLSFVTCKGCRAPKSFALAVVDRVSIDRYRRVHA
jgi:hypothetical protein